MSVELDYDDGYADGYEDGTADTLAFADIEPTFDDGYAEALEDAHAAIAAETGIGSQEEALRILEELIDSSN